MFPSQRSIFEPTRRGPNLASITVDEGQHKPRDVRPTSVGLLTRLRSQVTMSAGGICHVPPARRRMKNQEPWRAVAATTCPLPQTKASNPWNSAPSGSFPMPRNDVCPAREKETASGTLGFLRICFLCFFSPTRRLFSFCRRV